MLVVFPALVPLGKEVGGCNGWFLCSIIMMCDCDDLGKGMDDTTVANPDIQSKERLVPD